MGDLFGKDSEPQRVTQSVDVPDFLRPLVEQQSQTGQSSLRRLQSRLGGANADDLVAGFTPDQRAAFNQARQFATGETGALPTAQQTFMQTAQGQDVSSFLPESSLSALSGAAQGGAVPSQATDAAGNVIDAELMPAATRDALTSTAQGDFLFGGEGFDAAVDAAVRQAQPQVASMFGGAGRGTGGLAQAAIGQAASDAFARQFGQERQNQLSAAQSLGSLTQSGRGQRLQAAGLLGDLGLSEQGQQIQAGNALAGLADAERARQLSAAGQLPGLGMQGADILSRIGSQQQQLEQQRLNAPITAEQQLFGATGGGAPLGALFGSTTTQPTQSNPLAGALGGAASGFQIGGPWGALAGGILGGVSA